MGDAGAQNNLGIMYLKGIGVDQDYKLAITWFTLALESVCWKPYNVRIRANLLHRERLTLRSILQKCTEKAWV
jgi:TPR repeat protein